ncbi:predicted protein [Histoplasma capsulatum H143]|uniref:Uncharacterized protein n=1 Tax=Ajellomyces capsulatus (strain H143) TaxID=544712 RepID=C6HIK7_AJECH|nr:predicted protein [Histoplasma capsulatum H143]
MDHMAPENGTNLTDALFMPKMTSDLSCPHPSAWAEWRKTKNSVAYLGNFSKDKNHLAPSPPTDLKVFPSEILPKSTYQWRASMDACKRYTKGIPWKFKGTEARVRMSKHSSLVRRGRKAFPPQKVEIQTPPNDPSIRDVPKPDPTEKGTGKFAFCQC